MSKKMSVRGLFEGALQGALGNESIRSMVGSPLQSIERVLNIPTAPKMDMVDKGQQVVLVIELPGARKEDVTLTNDGVKVNLRVKRHSATHEGQEGRFVIKERSDSDWSRQIELPRGMKKGYSSALLQNGLLTITLEKDPGFDPTEEAIPID